MPEPKCYSQKELESLHRALKQLTKISYNAARAAFKALPTTLKEDYFSFLDGNTLSKGLGSEYSIFTLTTNMSENGVNSPSSVLSPSVL